MTNPLSFEARPPHISQDEADEYALGVLESADAARIAGHAATCPACSAAIDRAYDVTASLALAAPTHRVSDAVRHAVLRETGITRPNRWQRMSRNWQAFAAAAAAVIALAAIGGVLALWNQVSSLNSDTSNLRTQATQAANDRADARGLLIALVSPTSRIASMEPASSAAPAAPGRLVWNDQQHICWIAFEKLPAPPPGEVYQLWVRSGTQSWNLGTFTPDNSGMVTFGAKVSDEIGAYESAVITMGPVGGSHSFNGNALYTANLGSATSEYQ